MDAKAIREKIHAYTQKGRQNLSKEDRQSMDLLQADLYAMEGKLVQAAQLYYQLSHSQTDKFQLAVRYAVLAPVSARRQGLLTTILSDSRSKGLPGIQFVERNSKQCILHRSDIEAFLQQYGVQGSMSLFAEHIVIGISHIYQNISIKRLSEYLYADEDSIYQLLEHMICSKKLGGVIDQVEGVLYFKGEESQSVESFCRSLYQLASEL